MQIERLENESDFEWKLRLVKSKINKELDLDWQEIVDVLGISIHPDELRKRSYGMMEYDEYIHGFGGVATTILSVSDMHIPFQLPISLLSEYCGKVDILQLNGDIVDCQSLSKFSKSFRISPIEEIIQGRQYLIDLINYIKPKKVVCNYGNHDARLGMYLSKHLDTDIIELMPNNSLELMFEDGFYHYDKQKGSKTYYEPIKLLFDDIDVEYVNDWKSKIGKTWFVHPLAYRSGMLATCDKAKDYLQDTDKEGFDCVVMAHTHSVGDSKKGFVRLLEQGAFADVTKMIYSDGRLTKPQKEGFAIICQDKDGNLIQDKTKIITLN